MKKVFLKISQNSQENTCARVSFLIKLQAYEIFKNTFSTEHPRTTASVTTKLCSFVHLVFICLLNKIITIHYDKLLITSGNFDSHVVKDPFGFKDLRGGFEDGCRIQRG